MKTNRSLWTRRLSQLEITTDWTKDLAAWQRVGVLGGLALLAALTGAAIAMAGSHRQAAILRPATLLPAVAALMYANRTAARQMRKRSEDRRDWSAARQLQQSFQPKSLPADAAFSFASACRMSREIGGDYYDVIELSPGKVLLVIADVSGKGASAALLMSGIHALVRALSRGPEITLDGLAMAIHTHIVRNTDASRYVTALFVLLDSERKEIRYLNAGHNPALILCDGNIEELGATSPPLGLPLPESLLGVRPVTLEVAGEFTLLLFTDGVIERENREGEQYGSERLREVFSRTAGQIPKARIHELLSDNDRFAGNLPASDDLTVLIANHTAVTPGGAAAAKSQESQS